MSAPARWLGVEARPGGGEAEDGRLAEALLTLGGRAVQETDGWSVTYLDPRADGADPATAAGDARALEIRLAELSGFRSVEVRLAWQEHEDWAELWKRGLEPRRIGRRIVVTPSWHTPDSGPGDVVIVLDPGMAFGNAEHGTTRGCLRLLEDVVRSGDRILDVGTGSAVLAIAAARLGAVRVDALEADPWAVAPARDNVRANGVADTVRVREIRADVRALAELGEHDGVVANIEAGVLEALMPGLARAVRAGGWLLLSGVLADQLPGVLGRAAERGLELAATDEDGPWRSVLLRR